MKAIKVQFKKVGKKYFFSPANFSIKENDYVVVETIRGIELGHVVGDVFDISERDLVAELKPVLRIATKKDLDDYKHNIEAIPNVLEKCKFHIKHNNLEMKLLNCEYTLDRAKLIIYFEADGRVDFRQLVKDLAEEFRVRIELRQVGSRDGAKVIGGLGPCGLIMCCVTFIGEFDNVSIKMAKNQNLSLNPQKISGTCGKLLCCIKYENEVYQELRENLPDVGDFVTTEEGQGKVLSVDVLNRRVKVKYQDEKITIVEAKNVKFTKRQKKRDDIDKELRELED